MKKPIAIREQVIISLINNELNLKESAQLLGCTKRAVSTYLKKYLVYGLDGLVDRRHSNNYKLSSKQRAAIIDLKTIDRWRSPRNIRDKLDLSVHKSTVWRVLRDEGLTHENVARVKAIVRFEADGPNDMWTDSISWERLHSSI